MSLSEFHGFRNSVRWRLAATGIEIEGSGVERTPGPPGTVTRIWETFGGQINAAAAEFNVTCATIIATIATESSGEPTAVRKEPGYTSDSATPHRISAGLMQTLISTARGALSDNTISREWLLNPANSIRAGTAYIAGQRNKTNLDPPMVACAYNAGSLIHQNGTRNRWKMRQFPIGTAEHCDRFVRWFNDAVSVLAIHSLQPAVPYEALLGGIAPPPPKIPAHPAPTRGNWSQEATGLVTYLEASGVPHRVTSVVRSRPPSRHAQQGTSGRGLAVDFAGPVPSVDSRQLASIFEAFAPIASQLYELIYAGPQVTKNVKRGKWVAKYAQADHHDHVHVAVNKSVLVRWLGAPQHEDEEEDMLRLINTTQSDGTVSGIFLEINYTWVSWVSPLKLDAFRATQPVHKHEVVTVPRDYFDLLDKIDTHPGHEWPT